MTEKITGKDMLEGAAVMVFFAGAIIGGSDGPYFPYVNFIGAGLSWACAGVLLLLTARLRGGNNGQIISAPGACDGKSIGPVPPIRRP